MPVQDVAPEEEEELGHRAIAQDPRCLLFEVVHAGQGDRRVVAPDPFNFSGINDLADMGVAHNEHRHAGLPVLG